MPGLDPGIHPSSWKAFEAMDHRVKPGDDDLITSQHDQCPTITGTLVAGGVLRLRCVRTMPSMMVIPTPGRSPS